ncbi:lipid II:glycine glycyltransferase FemX [Flavobacterium johnsoniae]|uniref:Lipid II:glycine glycyltransferase (Peptidoglycan interpeptide bridge formation enzyme) n=1 Tax=Flavobacterium johnsoniae TaxID=986 RepID=A0A1M5L0R9_FLAJO|nr:peptidoglycan bridge formation glycyltransferase FemA/FemB family protein [Flavobacterium johnsoniae]SHG58545.1 Lipid II:glycine glycyltransferase (Peptidoglycan interpeptide bridge formation enzyme) [Flavobacterium johnsoniae]
MKIIFTKEKQWLDKWDEFVYENDRGSHLIFSDWLKSYISYGFDFEIGICLENEKIIGGFGAVIAKKSFFRFYIVPHGPIVSFGFEDVMGALIQNLYQRAKETKCCYAQYSIPFSENDLIRLHCYKTTLRNQIKNKGEEGNLFKYIYSSYGINWVDFNDTKTSEELLAKFALQPRRNINLAYRNDFLIEYSQTEEECREAYKLIEDNAREANYPVRKFEDIKDTILNLISKKKSFLMTVSLNGELKGAGLFVDCGNFLTYISGGTKKEKPDLNIGYVIHWEAIKKSYDFGYDGYNISMGGSEGVLKFKSKFMAQPVFFETPHYHFIINTVVFKMYSFLNEYLKKNKNKIALILKRIK